MSTDRPITGSHPRLVKPNDAKPATYQPDPSDMSTEAQLARLYGLNRMELDELQRLVRDRVIPEIAAIRTAQSGDRGFAETTARRLDDRLDHVESSLLDLGASMKELVRILKDRA